MNPDEHGQISHRFSGDHVETITSGAGTQHLVVGHDVSQCFQKCGGVRVADGVDESAGRNM